MVVSAAVVASTAVGGAPRALAVKPQPAVGVPRTWVGAWSAAPVTGTGSGFGDQTLREVVHTTMGGDQVRRNGRR